MNARVYNIVDVSEEPLEKDRNAARLKVYMLMEPPIQMSSSGLWEYHV